MFNATRENVILVGRLAGGDVDYTAMSPAESLARERAACADHLEAIGEAINAGAQFFRSHLLLSIFKMAELEVVHGEPTSTGSPTSSPPSYLLVFLLCAGLLVIARPPPPSTGGSRRRRGPAGRIT